MNSLYAVGITLLLLCALAVVGFCSALAGGIGALISVFIVCPPLADVCTIVGAVIGLLIDAAIFMTFWRKR